MSSTPKLMAAMTVACVVSALCLALVNGMTKSRIQGQQRRANFEAIRAVLPPFDNDPASDTLRVKPLGEGDGGWVLMYVGRKDGRPTGVGFEVAGEGYGGKILMVVGVDTSGHVSGVHVVKHSETPGLGTKIDEKGFRERFKGKSLAGSKLLEGDLAVKKDGGDVDAITGATISSRGVTAAVSGGLRLFEARKEVLLR